MLPDLAGVLLTPRLGFDPQSGRNSQRVELLGSSSGSFQFCDLAPAPFFSKPWFLYLSDEDEKNLPESVAKVIVSA